MLDGVVTNEIIKILDRIMNSCFLLFYHNRLLLNMQYEVPDGTKKVRCRLKDVVVVKPEIDLSSFC